MADSIHTRIVEAIVDRLNADIRRTNGYNYDLDTSLGGGGAQHLESDGNPVLESPSIVVDMWREDFETTFSTAYQVTAQLHLQLTLALPTDGTKIQTALQRLIDDVYRCLGAVRQESPVLEIDELEDIVLAGHNKIPWDEEDDFLDALIECQVVFQMSISDPTVGS